MVLINAFNSRAQFVTIPDAQFAGWLRTNGYAACMSGNQLDTSCPAVLNTHGLYCTSVPIHDLTGIQYFKNLDTLQCYYDSVTLIPSFPATLQYLDCSNNQLNAIPAFPPSLTYLNCGENSLLLLPALPAGVTQLYCGFNSISSLSALPTGLTLLYCNYNNISTLPALPATLVYMDCSSNGLASIPALPGILQQLICEINHITTLPVLNTTSLVSLNCTANYLDSIPQLPATLQTLQCGSNQIANLPLLPIGLLYLSCESNGIDSLQILPIGLQYLNCGMNNITALPLLPATLTTLACNQNQLTSLPELPDSLYQFNCYFNQYLTCLPQLKRIVSMQFYNCGVTCLPNYGKVTSSNPALNTLPLCGLFNTTGCNVYSDISGQVFSDFNHNCVFDGTDKPEPHVKVELFGNSNLLQQVYTGAGGDYSFQAPYGNYLVRVDTAGFPFKVICPHAGSISDTVNVTDSLSFGNNFSYECRPTGFDVGVTSIMNNYVTPAPGNLITINTICGDISALYGGDCATGIDGQVHLSFTGPVTYIGPATGALTTGSASGNIITWNISDFGAVNNYAAFNTLFQVNANATAGEPICITVSVTTNSGDFNSANNMLTWCFPVVNSVAGNEKEVYPAGQIDSARQWLTYTIRFRNTGTDTVQNIMVTDTLDPNLNEYSFDLLSASAKNVTQLSGNIATFNFPDINLPPAGVAGDSLASGFVQYRVQTFNNMPGGSIINNYANIYFKLANPVTTNTVADTVESAISGIQSLVSDDFGVRVFLNPANNQLSIEIAQSGKYTIRLFDIQGKLLYTTIAGGINNTINVSTFVPGVYLAEIIKGQSTQRVRWVKM
jgi:hypothetical protein